MRPAEILRGGRLLVALASDVLLEPLRRATCWVFGHRVLRDARGAPVADFEVCRRCGKFDRRLP